MRLTRLLRMPLGTVAQQIDHYCQFHPSALSIQQYLDFGRHGSQKASYLFLRKELLVRLANIMMEISLLPRDLLRMPSCKLVEEWYQQSFIELHTYEDTQPVDTTLRAFNESMQSVLKRHSHVVETMTEGLGELRQSEGIDVSVERSLQYFLDRFYINRISIRMLMNQHLLLFGAVLPETPRHVGCIDPACDVEAVCMDAYENARFLCDRYYMTAPGLKLECLDATTGGRQVNVVAVPSHMYHILFELFKNAMRATVEYHGMDNDDLPDIRMFVVKGKEDLSLKVCDRGGGVSRLIVDSLFNYMYSTAPPPERDGSQAPLVGYGYGLPLSRLYARYFQGDLFLVSMEGHGTDACIYMKALAPEASELIPVYSTSSRRVLTQSTQAADWSNPHISTHHGAAPTPAR